jgi:hypothetical protein
VGASIDRDPEHFRPRAIESGQVRDRHIDLASSGGDRAVKCEHEGEPPPQERDPTRLTLFQANADPLSRGARGASVAEHVLSPRERMKGRHFCLGVALLSSECERTLGESGSSRRSILNEIECVLGEGERSSR